MSAYSRAAIVAAALFCVVCALGIGANAQITVTSPVNNSTISMPAQLTASVSACAGSSNITLFGYSINSSVFFTRSPNNGLSKQINTTDYRLSSQPSPGTQYTIRYKAWSSAGECPEVDVVVNVSGTATSTASNLDQVQNANGWDPNPCPETQKSTYGLVGWFWVWDAGTAQCIESDSSTYPVGGSGEPSGPSIDGQSRLFYVDWESASSGGNPGMRSSENYGNSSSATNFVYDTYLYFKDPQNVQNVEMDMNQADSGGNLFIYGVQCAGPSYDSWQYTTNSGGSHWNSSSLSCNPQTWAADEWHHVQIAAHRVGNSVSYDTVTFDGTTQSFNVSNVDSYFPGAGWTPGALLLNFQIDGIYNAGKEATATTYIDGMTMIWW